MKTRMGMLILFSGALSLTAQAKSLLSCEINEEVPSVLQVARNINPQALQYGLEAYNCAVGQGIGTKPVLTLIDYTLPSTERRLWVIDVKSKKILFNTLVAQGKYTGGLIARYFSNTPESKKSSIGLFITEQPYTGHAGYSLRIKGLETGFNDKAESRAIVIHGADYVSESFARRVGRIGLSWGCPAVSRDVVKPLIDTVKNGSLVFSYYPDPRYLAQSKFLHCTPQQNAGNVQNTTQAPTASADKPRKTLFSSLVSYLFYGEPKN